MKNRLKSFYKPTVFILIFLIILIFNSCKESNMNNNNSKNKKFYLSALKMADFLIFQQNEDGVIPDTPSWKVANMDSNMEYALMGIAAAYKISKENKYLNALERGIKWLSNREEMEDPEWKGSWYYVYSSEKPYENIQIELDNPDIIDIRGVSSTSALYVYLLYLHYRLSGSRFLVKKYSKNAKAALNFLINKNRGSNGFFYNSWQKGTKNGKWNIWKFYYTSDQADVYLGMLAGWLLFKEPRFLKVALALKEKTSKSFFIPELKRYAVGKDERGCLDTELDEFNGIFSQGYLSWVFGENTYNLSAYKWLSACLKPDGELVCCKNDPRFALSISIYIMSSFSLNKPFPEKSAIWLLENCFDKTDGGVKDTPEYDSPKFSNVSGLTIIAFLEMLPF